MPASIEKSLKLVVCLTDDGTSLTGKPQRDEPRGDHSVDTALTPCGGSCGTIRPSPARLSVAAAAAAKVGRARGGEGGRTVQAVQAAQAAWGSSAGCEGSVGGRVDGARHDDSDEGPYPSCAAADFRRRKAGRDSRDKASRDSATSSTAAALAATPSTRVAVPA
jgi:hypothetical protein